MKNLNEVLLQNNYKSVREYIENLSYDELTEMVSEYTGFKIGDKSANECGFWNSEIQYTFDDFLDYLADGRINSKNEVLWYWDISEMQEILESALYEKHPELSSMELKSNYTGVRYSKTIIVDLNEATRLQSLLDQDEVDFKSEDVEEDSILFYSLVEFDDGYKVCIKVCSGQTNCWSEAVLFDDKGIEIGVTEPSFDFIGEYNFSIKKCEYVVNVEAA